MTTEPSFNYYKIFDPPLVPAAETSLKPEITVGDRRDGKVYVYTDEIILAVNVALATKRPLLIKGPSGAGKSSIAANIADVLNRKYYEVVVTSRMEAMDLLWHMDAVRRLADAQAQKMKDDIAEYVKPGVLWWALDPDSAARRGQAIRPGQTLIADPARNPVGTDSVVLIDEIDKADPDLPNNLLVALGSLQFDVPPLGLTVAVKHTPLIIITTNQERELSKPFLRRCVSLDLPPITQDRLKTIGYAHFGTDMKTLCDQVAELFTPESAPTVMANASTDGVSAAEYIDAVRACLELKIEPKASDPIWARLLSTIKSIVPLDPGVM